MSNEQPSAAAEGPVIRRRVRRRRTKLRYLWTVLGLAALVVLLSAIYVVTQGLRARSNLENLRADLVRLESAAATSQPTPTINALAARVRSDADKAHSATSGPIWGAWTHAPRIGVDLRIIRTGTQIVDDVSARALPPVTSFAAQVATLRHGTTIDVNALRSAAPGLTRADAAMQQATRQVDDMPLANMSLTAKLQQRLDDAVTRLGRQVHALSAAAQVGPAMLGADGPRNYFVGVQNEAEGRASGGIISAYAFLTTNHGNIHLVHTGSDVELPEAHSPVIRLGSEFDHRYADFDATSDWRNATMTPDASVSARIAAALWHRVHPSAPKLDGVILVDSNVLADILTATGPVDGPDGVRLNAGNVLSLTLVDYYKLFPAKAARGDAFAGAAKGVFTAIQNGQGSLPRLVERLGHSAVTNHLTVYSLHPREERVLRTTEVSGALPKRAAPFLQVVTQDVGASKLSVYLRRSVTYTGNLSPQNVDLGDGKGPQPVEVGGLTVTLRNTAPASGLPPYVTLRQDLPGNRSPVPGSERIYVSIYVGASGVFDGAKRDGHAFSLESDTDEGLSVFSTTIELAPGQSTTLQLQLTQPTSVGSVLTYRPQPLALPEATSISQG